MGIFGQSVEKKREKEIRQEAKDIVKALVNAGMDKQMAKDYLEVMRNTLVEACFQKEGYAESKKRMASGRIIMDELLIDIAQKEPAEVRTQLGKLAQELADIYHECTIRRDDMDFASTYAYISKASKTYDGAERLMLQSELENLLHMVTETLEWEEPDFCALAVFCKYGNRADLADIENHQRNEMILRFYKQQYWDDFEKNLAAVSMDGRIKDWIDEKLRERGSAT